MYILFCTVCGLHKFFPRSEIQLAKTKWPFGECQCLFFPTEEEGEVRAFSHFGPARPPLCPFPPSPLLVPNYVKVIGKTGATDTPIPPRQDLSPIKTKPRVWNKNVMYDFFIFICWFQRVAGNRPCKISQTRSLPPRVITAAGKQMPNIS